MGRKPTTNLNLPPRMRARHRGDKIWFYYDTGKKKPRTEIPLGNDFVLALRKYADLEMEGRELAAVVATFGYAAERYQREVVPTKAPATQRNNALYLAMLLKFFNDPPVPLGQIEPIHVRQYLDWRVQVAKQAAEARNSARRSKGNLEKPTSGDEGKTIANREVALFSAIWNQAREWGYTDKANPCAGVRKHRETGRDIYIEDEIYQAVYQAADEPLRDAMDLAYLTGQRPGDTLAMSETDIREGVLSVKQAKTNAKLRISIKGKLEALIERMLARKRKNSVHVLLLVVNEHGQRLGRDALRVRFDKAREKAATDNPKLAKAIRAFQFRDLRAKAGTDKAESSGDIRKAQKQLGHATVSMTEHYVRNRKGDLSDPTQ